MFDVQTEFWPGHSFCWVSALASLPICMKRSVLQDPATHGALCRYRGQCLSGEPSFKYYVRHYALLAICSLDETGRPQGSLIRKQMCLTHTEGIFSD